MKLQNKVTRSEWDDLFLSWACSSYFGNVQWWEGSSASSRAGLRAAGAEGLKGSGTRTWGKKCVRRRWAASGCICGTEHGIRTPWTFHSASPAKHSWFAAAITCCDVFLGRVLHTLL
ncbi:hypothetical protein E2C01_084033 [Portunus trituberculatus]|uniref:Uncharacterized protein n=1 Tax=Portunus trituberculatus TaxID=210409 RepID=A0A5B7IU80_PORTR|nr:hypothetical protein [Portunus trituberculatus]